MLISLSSLAHKVWIWSLLGIVCVRKSSNYVTLGNGWDYLHLFLYLLWMAGRWKRSPQLRGSASTPPTIFVFMGGGEPGLSFSSPLCFLFPISPSDTDQPFLFLNRVCVSVWNTRHRPAISCRLEICVSRCICCSLDLQNLCFYPFLLIFDTSLFLNPPTLCFRTLNYDFGKTLLHWFCCNASCNQMDGLTIMRRIV